jgi:hypothetical protein
MYEGPCISVLPKTLATFREYNYGDQKMIKFTIEFEISFAVFAAGIFYIISLFI